MRLMLDLSDEAFSSCPAAIARDLVVPTDIASDLFGIDIAARVARDRELVDDALAELDAGDPLVAIGPDLDVARADAGLSAGELPVRSEERRVGKECGSTCRYRVAPCL